MDWEECTRGAFATPQTKTHKKEKLNPKNHYNKLSFWAQEPSLKINALKNMEFKKIANRDWLSLH